MAIIQEKDPQENLNISPSADYIFYWDNMLPEWTRVWAMEQMDAMEWKYGQASYPGGGKFFGQILKDHNGEYKKPWSPIIDVIFQAFIRTKLNEVLPNAQYLSTKKIIINGQLPHTPADPHSDTQAANCWTMIYHCSDTDGDNLFFDADLREEFRNKPILAHAHNDDTLTEIARISFKQGRCVLFPSWYIHQGLAPTDGWRVTIAFHMQIASDINQNRFITSII